MEYYQRNQIALGLVNCAADDIILISDLDEIPNPEVITYFKGNSSEVCKLEQVPFYYYLNYQQCMSQYWCKAKIARYKAFAKNNYTPQMIRMENKVKSIKNGGWHFGYLGGMEAIKYKIQSFAHQELNNEKYVNDKITKKIRLGLDLFGKHSRFVPVKITNEKFPHYIVENQDKYNHLIYPHIDKMVVIRNTIYCLLIAIILLPKRIIKKERYIK
jgi:beta-1,4-mannosyl-glycoprotein beta-1,4-N-acetylglucosaminyltransferase